MKKIIFAVAALSLLISVPVFAKEEAKEALPEMALDNPMRMGMSVMGKKYCPMMKKAQMVATDEGGVIILAGNKLMKYDADLNLVKETEIKMPMGPMGGKQCPMMGGNAAPVAAESQEKAA